MTFIRQVEIIKKNFSDKSSAELCEIANSNHRDRWSEEAFVAAAELLKERGDRNVDQHVLGRIQCKPRGLCSWNYRLDGNGHSASLEFTLFGEQGDVTADGKSFEICKTHETHEKWTLESSQQEVASAQKSSAFARTFDITCSIGALILRPEAPADRAFRILRSEKLMAVISPDHSLTRRATIVTLEDKCDFPTICFSFWLAALTWRRPAPGAGGSAQ